MSGAETLLTIGAVAVIATTIGTALGVWVSLRMLRPLRQRCIDRERRLVADIGHELRTPLTTLTTSVDVMVRHEAHLPEHPRQALGLVRAELEHLRRLLDDLLALARAEAGIHRSDPEPLSLRELLLHTLAGRRYSADLLTVVEEAMIEGHKLELERAIANLLDNADRHGGGVVEVTVTQVGANALIMVDDAGPGVPPADHTRIFERFVTGRISRRADTGTGIGLALVAETVAAHQGTVVCAERPGGGARFIVRLPTRSVPPPTSPNQSPSPPTAAIPLQGS